MSSHIVPLNTQEVRENNRKLKNKRRKQRRRNKKKDIKQKNPYDQTQSLIRSNLLKIQQEEITRYELKYFSKNRNISNTSFATSFRNDILRFSGEDTLFVPTILGKSMVEEMSEDSESSEEGTIIVIDSSDEETNSTEETDEPIVEHTESSEISDVEENALGENEESAESESSESEESATNIESSETSDDEPFRKRSKKAPTKQIGRAKYPEYKRGSEFTPIEASSEIFDSPDLILKDYQLEAINFLFKNYCENRPCCLGHEMGLGKTIISLSTLNLLYKRLEVFGPFLIVVPLITLQNWEREATKWLPHFCLQTAWGTKSQNTKIESLDIMGKKYYKALSDKNPFLVVTTYEFLKERAITSRRWACVIFDEAHRLKSQKTQWRSHANKLKKDFMILLTGTPMQNSPEELWSLLNFLDKEKFPSFKRFEAKYGELDSESKIADLKIAISPYLIRRTKAQVLSDEMPPKEEILIEIELSSIQKSVYRALIERKVNFFRSHFSSQQDLSYIVNNLRYCCNHPCLISGMEDYLRDEEKRDDKSILIYSSSKMVVVHKLLKKFRDANEKVLILSQFLDMLGVLESYLQSEQISYVRIDGSTPSEERQRNIDKFQTDPQCRVFLLSTKIGQGINLTAANHVIIYDSDFNPFNDSQAAARCHRIGQTKKVFVYRLITKDSYEKYIITRASKKLGREKLVLADTQTDENATEELERMIKYGVYSMFLNKENNTKTDDELINTDIEKILEGSSKVQVQGEEDGILVDTLNLLTGNEKEVPEKQTKQPNEVIKSVYYVPVEEVSEIPLDDPNFWDKAFPDYCDIYTLESRLKDLTPFEAHEFEIFFNKLENVSSAAINAKQKVSKDTEKLSGVIEEDKKGLPTKSQLHAFLLQVSNPKYNHHYFCFKEEHLNKIVKWIDKLETKTLRNRKVWRSSDSITTPTDRSDSSEDEEFVDAEELRQETAELHGITHGITPPVKGFQKFDTKPAKKKLKMQDKSKPSLVKNEKNTLKHKKAQKNPKKTSHKNELRIIPQPPPIEKDLTPNNAPAQNNTTLTNQVVPYQQPTPPPPMSASKRARLEQLQNFEQNINSFQQVVRTMSQHKLMAFRDHYTKTYAIINNNYKGPDKEQILSKNNTMLQIINAQLHSMVYTPQGQTNSQVHHTPQNNTYTNTPNTTSTYNAFYTQSDGLRTVATSTSTTIQNSVIPNNMHPVQKNLGLPTNYMAPPNNHNNLSASVIPTHMQRLGIPITCTPNQNNFGTVAMSSSTHNDGLRTAATSGSTTIQNSAIPNMPNSTYIQSNFGRSVTSSSTTHNMVTSRNITPNNMVSSSSNVQNYFKSIATSTPSTSTNIQNNSGSAVTYGSTPFNNNMAHPNNYSYMIPPNHQQNYRNIAASSSSTSQQKPKNYGPPISANNIMIPNNYYSMNNFIPPSSATCQKKPQTNLIPNHIWNKAPTNSHASSSTTLNNNTLPNNAIMTPPGMVQQPLGGRLGGLGGIQFYRSIIAQNTQMNQTTQRPSTQIHTNQPIVPSGVANNNSTESSDNAFMSFLPIASSE